MLKKSRITYLFFFLMLLSPVWAQASTLSATQSLSFGTLIPIANSGSVSVSLAGAINTGGSVSIAPSGTSYSQGLMTFTGTGLSALIEIVTITVLDTTITLTNSRPGGGTVTVNNFVNDKNINVTLLSPTVNNIKLGGTMNFTSTSKGGNYTGSVRVRANGLLSGTVDTTVPVILTLWNTLSMSETTRLNFGVIERLTGNSVVRINPQTGARSVFSGASGINLSSGSPAATAALFSVSGEPSKSVTVTLPSFITLTGNKGGTMTVNNFSSSPAPTSAALDSSGNLALRIGADLTIGTNQTTGTYSGTYSLTVNY